LPARKDDSALAKESDTSSVEDERRIRQKESSHDSAQEFTDEPRNEQPTVGGPPVRGESSTAKAQAQQSGSVTQGKPRLGVKMSRHWDIFGDKAEEQPVKHKLKQRARRSEKQQ
jgi:hypothetical protein